MPAKKRRKVDEDVVLVPRDPKRVRRDASPSRGVVAPAVDVERDFDFAGVGEIGKLFSAMWDEGNGMSLD